MYQLQIDKTGKGYGKNDKFSRFDHETIRFSDINQVKEYIKETYGKSKRQPMYKDGKDGKAVKCGIIIGFHNSDYSHSPVNKWIQQDWITLEKIEQVNL